ncbi:hypothetical protein H4R26_002784 [Coemansia thaxteri]|uniref:Exportin-4 n=1 Tax=Coemansia thaxteri TaxID=2663907 RepID=A0A9W8EFN0_9FUNG|nr:hypothetical protein H4R26_002784 [Coemansia thaxteri]
MDYAQTLADLEQACGDFQIPATRFAAEKHLQEFGKRPDAIEAGKYVLAYSNYPTAKFFALRGIKESIIASYNVVGLLDALKLRDELLQLACQSSRDLESFVLESLCWVIAVITKRAWLESSEQQRELFIQKLYEDILHHTAPSVGISTAVYLIDEFSGGSKCSEFHLPWEFHFACKAAFESSHMMRLFEAALKVLHRKLQRSIEMRHASPSGSRTFVYERKSALHLADRILNWSFTPPDAHHAASASFGRVRSGTLGSSAGQSNRRRPSGEFDDSDSSSNSGTAILDTEDNYRAPLFPQQWQSLILDNDVINMFFSIYQATLNDQMHEYFSAGSSHIALQCMIQISGLRGKGLFASNGSKSGDSVRVRYAQVIMQNHLQMIRHVCSMDLAADGSEDIVVATTQMIRQFVEAQLDEQPSTVVAGKQLHSLALLTAGVPETLEYFGETSKFICLLLQAAAGVLKSENAQLIDDDFGDFDNYFVMQAFDELASAWSAVINEIREWSYTDEVSEPAHSSGAALSFDGVTVDNRSVLSSFVQFLTTTAYMIRSEYIQLRMLMCEDSVQSNDSRSETQTIDHGLLAKDYVVYEDQLQFFALLARLDIRTSVDRLHESLRSRCAALHTEFGRLERIIGSGSYEGSSNRGSQHTVDLLHEQIHWIVLLIAHTLADSGTSERVLIPQPVIEYSKTCSGPEQDYIVQVVMSILELLQFELVSPSSTIAAYASPLLAETLFWALRRIAPVYLLIDCSDYHEISQSIVAAFGQAPDRGNGAAISGGILDLVRRAFDLWTSEEDVLQMCGDMLLAFSQRAGIAQATVESSLFAPLMHYLVSNMHRFPESIHSSIIEALAVLCCHSPSVEHERSFAQLKLLILGELNQATSSQGAGASQQDNRTVYRILDGLDMLDGILSAANHRNMDMVFDMLFETQPILERLLSLYAIDHGVPRKVIQIVESAARYLDISSLPDNEHMVLFSRNIRLILQQFQKLQQGQVSSSQVSAAGVDSLSDTTALISAISYLVHNEMGFASNEACRSTCKHVSDDFGETEVFGLYCVHTTTTPSQLLTPNVLRAYMQLLSDMIQFRIPSLIRWLPVQTWRAIVDMLVEGVGNAIYDVGRRSYEAIGKLGAFIKINGLGSVSTELGQLLRQGVQRLLGSLLRALLFSAFDAELVESAGVALVTLGLIDPQHLQACFGELFAQSKSAVFGERLSATFSKFNADLEANEAVHAFLSSGGPIPDPIDGASLRQPLFEFLVSARAVLRVK